ncbi:MAG: YraN family protein [Desulfuromonas sp.]|nr:MAG: YraN family protein [Desulfuromonas sp.]
MTETRLKLGAWGEAQAASFLRKQGAKILARNYTAPTGEIDIIARHKKSLLFVEVKTRTGLQFGQPAEAVGPTKQRQIIRTAQWYLQQESTNKLQPQFDVISVLVDGDAVKIEHFPNAFDADL